MTIREGFLDLSAADLARERPEDDAEDVYFPEALVAAVVREYTAPGELVLDPFAGYGTTLFVSEQLGRRCIGIELLPERVELIRSRVGSGVTIIEGDARLIDRIELPAIDLCLTSPPYMTRLDHPENPLTAYETLDGDYATYLAELHAVFGRVWDLVRPGGHVVVNVGDMEENGVTTALVDDLAAELRPDLGPCRRIELRWDELPPDITADVCLVFAKPSP